jgi:Zn-dependent protease with chaperone function
MRGIAMRTRLCLIAALASLVVMAGMARAQTVVRPGFNLFTVQQDIDVGKQSAAQIETQLPMVTRPSVTRYVSALGAKLARYAPGAAYPYQFKVVNLSDVNAFALPGGFVYVHRGLIEHAHTEGELAGVLAHEIAHVALRHPTNRVSKAYLANAGIGILGGLVGSRSSNVIRSVGGFGLNSLFLKNSRTAEEQADIVGAQIMARAGYDPMDMARFFDTLRRQAGGNPSRFATFFSDHPAPANRAERVRREAALIGPVRRTSEVGDIALARAELQRMPPAPTRAQVAQAAPAQAPGTAVETTIERPSSRYRVFRPSGGFFAIRYPDNWRAYAASGSGVTIAPPSGIITGPNGERRVACAVIVNHYVPFDGSVDGRYHDPLGSLFGRTSLEEATSDLVRHIMEANSYLHPVPGSERGSTLSGQRSLSVDLTGAPPNGVEERVRVYSRELPDGHVVYVLAVAPRQEYDALQAAFDRMVSSLDVNEEATHGS